MVTCCMAGGRLSVSRCPAYAMHMSRLPQAATFEKPSVRGLAAIQSAAMPHPQDWGLAIAGLGFCILLVDQCMRWFESSQHRGGK